MTNSLFKIIDGNLCVKLRSCFNADNIWKFSPDIFIDRIVRSNYKELHIIADDCEDLHKSGFISILHCAVNEKKLTKDDIKLIGYTDPNLDWLTFIRYTPFPLNNWLISKLNKKDFEIDNKSFNYKFLAVFRRFTLYRLRMAKFLYENYFDHTLLSCLEKIPTSLSDFADNQLFYKDELFWDSRNLPLILDYRPKSNNVIDYFDMISSITTLKKEYLIEVVIESNICDSSVFTEKTMRGFYTGKPFVLFSGAYALKNLNSFGFKTFHPVINESYDTIENTEDRFNAVCKEIGRLAEIPNHELQSIFDHLLPVFEHNQNVFFENSHSWKNYKLPNLLYKSKYNW